MDAQCLFLDRVVNVVEEGVDVAVRIGELPDSSLQAIRVGRVRRVLVAAPAYLAAQGRPQRPEDLAAHSASSPPLARRRHPEWRFNIDGRTAVQRVRAAHAHHQQRFGDLGGAGRARHHAAVELPGGDRIWRPARWSACWRTSSPRALPVHVVHHEGRHVTQKVRGFVDMAVEALRADPALR